MAIETPWDALNVALGVASAAANISQGNYGAAAVDALGVAIDAAATATPGVPGGAATGIKAARCIESAKSGITAFASHSVNRAIERGFKTSDILKIIREGSSVKAMGRYGSQTRYTLGGNTVVLNSQGKIITVFSNAPGTAKGLGKGAFIPF